MAPLHIGGVMVFEPRPAGGAPSVSELVARLERGLEQLPRYRDRLSSTTTGGFAWPFWSEDERFRVANHVRAVSVPPPSGRLELLDWAGEFYSERLDRTQPLWEMAIVEGLAGGRWALATRPTTAWSTGLVLSTPSSSSSIPSRTRRHRHTQSPPHPAAPCRRRPLGAFCRRPNQPSTWPHFHVASPWSRSGPRGRELV